jgi:hypothetical protein
MIVALLLVAAQPAAAPPEAAPAGNDIVIIGQKVRKVKFSVKADKAGNPVCRIRRSSGDAEIDALACDAGRACAHSASQAAMIACITPRWKQIAAQVAERRRLARESGAR